ncbi:MAG TPA: UDP-3-O-(3-hydroxymyristoyl)glucosamine N-acyltransferase [Xanthomonadales bacterium]|nr:UDP-3-O-(3-hydroxymyristoyl)glucosamine N-acyltransferase [Xanthomonadales bacterium]
MSAITVAELAARFGLALHGNGAALITGVGTLESAQADQLSFLANPKYRGQLAHTAAGAIVAASDAIADARCALLVSRNPYADFARIAAEFEPRPARPAGIHPSAVVDPSATVDARAHVGPLVTIAAGASVAAGAVIGSHCCIGEDCHVGPGAHLVARVTLVTRVRIGARVLIHPGVVIGADGFGLAMDGGHWLKVPQLGGVVIGDDCEIGANTTIDRGALGDTVLEEDVRLDNQIQIAHNVRIGAHTAMAGCSAVAGSARIGRYCLIGGAAGVLGHLEICDKVTITAMSLVTHSIREPGEYSSGTPLMDNRLWRRSAVRFKQLDELARQITTTKRERST